MFKIIKKSNKSQARLGVLKTAHGSIKTPFFMPCATQGAVKHVSTKEVGKIGATILLANTYHLMLKPGEKLIKQAGGLHDFMNWRKPILTDSGGFQVFSLGKERSKSGKSLVELTKDGVKFKSYIDGKEYYLTPEKALKIQIDLGVDIAVCLDVCPALPAEKEDLKKAVELTSYWAKKTKDYAVRARSLAREAPSVLKSPRKATGETPAPAATLLFCVIQGGLDKKLRLESLKDLVKIGFDGYNIGGLSVGESSADMYKVLDYLVPEMPENKPRYLMGVGYPENIIEAVKRGVDMFDCVIPTREGRHGRLFTSPPSPPLLSKERGLGCEVININRAKFEKDFSPINPDSKLPELREYSKAYLHYLFKINEPLGQRLASLHNLEFYFKLMDNIRSGIGDGCL